ncbi:hypothetical protein GCM10023116_02240 [Kistimonas scapharcae]|uniref:Uncharacterized protein n=1 Tax=Kistimonas scapharcae TaxID=1036133 RepID=A0ABP8UWJ3_9GAMM
MQTIRKAEFVSARSETKVQMKYNSGAFSRQSLYFSSIFPNEAYVLAHITETYNHTKFKNKNAAVEDIQRQHLAITKKIR